MRVCEALKALQRYSATIEAKTADLPKRCRNWIAIDLPVFVAGNLTQGVLMYSKILVAVDKGPTYLNVETTFQLEK